MEPDKSADLKNTLNFIDLVTKLKHLPRRGWEYRNVEKCETIAGHMYVMGMMTFLLDKDTKLDRLKCLQLALVHDLAECIVGDIIPHDNIPEEVKHKLEDDALKKIVSYVSEDCGKLIYDLYKEYEAKATPEAKFVKDLDRFDMIFTAFDYEKRDDAPKNLQELFDAVEGKFQHPLIKELANELMLEREKHTK